MNLLSTLPIAMSIFPFGSFDGSMRSLIPIVAIVMPFFFVVAILLMKHISDQKARQLQHDTIRLALEKGQPLPPELLNPSALNPESIKTLGSDGKPKSNDRKAGLILIAVGASLFLFLGGADSLFNLQSTGGIHHLGGMQWVGLIPGFIGVALLVNWMLERTEKKDDTN